MKYIITGLGVLLSATLLAMKPTYLPDSGTELDPILRSGGCSPSQSQRWMEFNDVRCLIETGGSMWQDRAQGVPAYEVPAGGGASAIFSGGLWMGGEDVNGQLKLAAIRFRSGGQTDYWTGPLSFDVNTVNLTGVGQDFSLGYGAASVDEETCKKWDQFYEIQKSEVTAYIGYLKCIQDPQCDVATEYLGYAIPSSILNWPGNGNGVDEDQFMAPFWDGNGDGLYTPDQPSAFDFPHYVTGKTGEDPWNVDCKTTRKVNLYGDRTLWWVFNDKGNIHTETGCDPIGMEIRAQAFAFNTTDEINRMTFYNYELINRGTQTLYNTYFAQYVDADLGGAEDDFVGCDVQRGLGYCYNGDNFDADNGASKGYGANPPAIGVDFFEGPYQDNDGKDNPGPNADNNFDISYNEAFSNAGIPYGGLGIGYGDSIADNERFGMRRFTFYNNTPGISGDPDQCIHHYNYMKGIWKNGQKFLYGGDALSSGVVAGVEADFMFPGNSDPKGFGTSGNPQADWDESTAGNSPDDRRFLQSAGPFTLLPGQVNNITVGVVYARGGSNLQSIEALRVADDKAQALFDNCFRVLDGPSAPIVGTQELDQEVILTLTPAGNNVNEGYKELDFTLPKSYIDENGIAQTYSTDDLSYKFEGYQVYQVRSLDVGLSDLSDVSKARLVLQTDIKNDVGQLINYEKDEVLGSIPVEKVSNTGSDQGIIHSFSVKEDLFAAGDNALVNFKEYYYIAIAYGYNNYKSYDANDPTALDGQRTPYIPSRLSADGTDVKIITVVPHDPTAENGGTVAQASYGDKPVVTRIEGAGNGTNQIVLSEESTNEILTNNFAPSLKYAVNGAPINVKVVDPLGVPNDKLIIKFEQPSYLGIGSAQINGNFPIQEFVKQSRVFNDATYSLYAESNTANVFSSDKSIELENEQIFPEFGVSVTIAHDTLTDIIVNSSGVRSSRVKFLNASLTYADPSKPWLQGIPDSDGETVMNWILSGTQEYDDNTSFNDKKIGNFADPDGEFEQILGGTFAPYALVQDDASIQHVPGNLGATSGAKSIKNGLDLSLVPSIQIVMTSDKSLWTRCAVVETQDNAGLAKFDPSISTQGADKFKLRRMPSVDKDGNPDNSTFNGSPSYGMGWFPGYAINKTTGERMNIAFGEDSFLESDNGNDMLFNPSSRYYTNIGEPIFGGKHYVYFFQNIDIHNPGSTQMRRYNGGSNLEELFRNSESNESFEAALWNGCAWVSMPVASSLYDWMSTDVEVNIDVSSRYYRYAVNAADVRLQNTNLSQNDWMPMYEVDLNSVATLTSQNEVANEELNEIRMVPNPYYGYSDYETGRLNNEVKIINLPDECTVTIYNSAGTLVRKYDKDNDITFIDWDLKNSNNITIAGGTYYVHVNAPGIGEKVVKWFGTVRPPDLENF